MSSGKQKKKVENQDTVPSTNLEENVSESELAVFTKQYAVPESFKKGQKRVKKLSEAFDEERYTLLEKAPAVLTEALSVDLGFTPGNLCTITAGT